MAAAQRVATQAQCGRAKCGCVLVSDGVIIGEGFNRPPGGLENQRRCHRKYEIGPGFRSDRTCCMHAEQRAILNALLRYPEKVMGSKLYFCRVDEAGLRIFSGKPYCTICSKMALEVGVAAFVLEHAEGLINYETQEYNDLSFADGKTASIDSN